MEEFLWIGGGSLFLGLLLRYWVGNRRFKRRGVGGLQHYSSYGKALLFSTIERIMNLLGFVLLVFGLLILLVYWVNKSEEEKEKKIEAKEDNSHDTTAHFLVPTEQGFGRKKLRNPKESELSLCYYGIIVRLTFSSYSRLH